MSCPTPEKQSHASKKAAWRHVDSLRHATPVSPDLKPYRCRCGAWHVGHSQASLGFRIREARRRGIA